MVAAAAISVSASAFADSLAYEDYTQLPLSLTKKEGTLIFSDCPEYADTQGILYEGTVAKGEGRLYYYHVNETGAPARLVVYAKADKKQSLTMKRAIRGDASSSYIQHPLFPRSHRCEAGGKDIRPCPGRAYHPL